MKRRPTTQDLTWLIDLDRNKRLDLNPPYQRRSVWTRKDKQFFLDTVLRNYPSPAIFIHKSINEAGVATYHVVDGKQRVETVLQFVNDKLRAPSDFGDVRIDGKKWSEIQQDAEIMQQFWNYQITVEMIDFADGGIVNEVFDRLNRNSRKLMRQEMRHAKYEGWFITLAEAEAASQEWVDLYVSSRARAKRMVDIQFVSELMLVVLDGRIVGFDQDYLDESYARYDDVLDGPQGFDEDAFLSRFNEVKSYLLMLEREHGLVARYAKPLGHFYSLWSALALPGDLPDSNIFSARYMELMDKVQRLSAEEDIEKFLREAQEGEYAEAFVYLINSRGASTEFAQRSERHAVLQRLVAASRV